MPKSILHFDYSHKEKISDDPNIYLVDGLYKYELFWFPLLGNREYRLRFIARA